MKIVIETLPHGEQRYKTCGDWWTDLDGTWQIRVSEMSHWSCEFLVALHELIEMALCKMYGIDEDQVTKFDKSWRPFGIIAEPGDDVTAPYYIEHQFACGIERLVAAQLGIVWPWYEDQLDSLDTE